MSLASLVDHLQAQFRLADLQLPALKLNAEDSVL